MKSYKTIASLNLIQPMNYNSTFPSIIPNRTETLACVHADTYTHNYKEFPFMHGQEV